MIENVKNNKYLKAITSLSHINKKKNKTKIIVENSYHIPPFQPDYTFLEFNKKKSHF